MRILALMILGLMVAGCVSGPTWVSDPSDSNNVKIERALRKESKKPEGKHTKADLEKVTRLNLEGDRLTDVPKGLACPWCHWRWQNPAWQPNQVTLPPLDP